jgi:exosortase
MEISTQPIKLAKSDAVSPHRTSRLFAIFLLACALPMVLLAGPMHSLLSLILHDDTYSHVPLIPAVSGALIWMDRERVFARVGRSWLLAGVLLSLGILSFWVSLSNLWVFGAANRPTFLMGGLVLAWAGAFAACFGADAIRKASFELLFLLFAIPIPEPLLSQLITALQTGSADAADAAYRLLGVPVLRDGYVFSLPGVSIRVAEECSGIRSTLALLITTVLAGHLWIRSKVGVLLLAVFVVPVAIVKNGLRIVTLSCLAAYVDPSWLQGRLHRYGGIPFFLLDLLMMGLAFRLVLWWERPRQAARRAVSC